MGVLFVSRFCQHPSAHQAQFFWRQTMKEVTREEHSANSQGDKFTFESADPEVEMLVVEVWDANIGTVGIGGVGIGAGGVSIGGVSICTGQSVGPQIIGYFAARVVELREGVRPRPHPSLIL